MRVLLGYSGPHMLRIAGMKASFRWPREARKFLAKISFFSRGSPFPGGGPTYQVYVDAFGEIFDGCTTEAKEVNVSPKYERLYPALQGSRGQEIGRLLPLQVCTPTWLGSGVQFHRAFREEVRENRAQQDHEAPGGSRECWIDINMRMVWVACLGLTGLSKFMISHYGGAGGLDHPWKVVNSAKHDSRVGEHFAPPSFPRVYELDYPDEWRELVRPRFLNLDITGMDYLSLEGETRSLFDDLCSIFEWAKGR
ncbi:uncharacterized protein LOC110006685 isoform X1 [Amborella trichopoda]|uniref:uncharacterized protein LOC110006685 isoform X1 n=1 Tax=Amborella trichopoda TaxID=13333 RepID=UPI0009C02F1F|nr:uncharacterized protein LOC110006685 isoform X1 [Amborella trichopoda]XP_020518767.1 uncharacterized protein LOC110006685 isoform X1 [Amborella trichopoda]|eukprot:XP_020518766.1 uncharacterized protein LOC110006685 isoform X1 [Amborella trichopoda]